MGQPSNSTVPRVSFHSAPPEVYKPSRQPLLHYLPPWVRNNLNNNSYKLVFRSWLAAWVSFLLLIPNRTLDTFGNATFFACMAVLIVPPSRPIQIFFFSMGLMVLGSLLGWAWGCLAMKVSLSARSQVLLLSEIKQAQQTAAASANPDAMFQLEVFQGVFLDPRSSLVFGVFFAVGVFFFAVTRAFSQRLALFSVFGTIFLDIICAYGPLFPVAEYTILQSFLTSTAASMAISCVLIVVVFPETLNHFSLNGISKLITILRQLVELQERVLTVSSPDQLKPDSEVASQIQTMVSGSFSGFEKLTRDAGMLSLEFSYGRFNGEDVHSILEPLTILISRIAGLQNLSRLIGTGNNTDFKISSAENADGFPERPSTPNNPIQGVDGYLLRELDSDSETIGSERDRVILPQEVLPILCTATAELRQFCAEALDIANQLIIRVNTTRWRNSTEAELDLDACIDKLRFSLEEFKSTGRLEVVKPFKHLTVPPNIEANLPRKVLFYAFVFEANLVWVAEGTLSLLETLAEIARKRPRARLWAPKSLRAIWKLIAMNDDDREDPPFHEDDLPLNPVEHHRARMAEKKDPDSKPPTNAFQRTGAFIFRCFAWCKTPQALYAFKYTIVSVALWLPGIFKTTAFFNYANKGIWALVMSQTTMEPYIADQIYSYFMRLTATTAGVVVGLVGWYIGAGNGGGNPFGIAAVMGVILIPLMFWRVFTPSILPAIMGSVTVLLVIGYSWMDSHLQLLGSAGVGWPVAWRRWVLVVIGSGASAIMMFIPPKSARTAVRHSNAAIVFQLSQLYGLLISEWMVVEEETELGEKRTPRQSNRWSDIFRKDFTKVGAKVQALKMRTSLARWEGSLRGAWPMKEYVELNNVETEMLFYIAQLAGAVYHLDPVWRTRLLHRTKFLNPNFIAEVMSVFSLVSRSLRTGEPLQETLPKNLLDRVFYHHRRTRPRDTEDDSTSTTADDHWEHLESPEYMSFAAGVTAVYKILSLLDRLHQITADLCGEMPLRGFAEWKELYDMRRA